MTYQDALERALNLSDDRVGLESFLRSVPSWRADLEQALAVSDSLSRDLRVLAPDKDVRERSQRKLMATVSRLARAEPPSRLWRVARTTSMLTLPRIFFASAVAAALLAFAVVVDFPPTGGGGAPAAEAVVIEGSVSEVSTGAVTISTTSDASRVVTLSSDTVLTDGFGNSVQASSLSAGQDVVLKGSQSGEEFVASRVELRDRLFGVVTALPGDSIHLSSPQGDFVILVNPETQFEGVIAVGSSVEIKLTRAADNSLLALEIEVAHDEVDEGEGDDVQGGSSASPAPAVSPVSQPDGSGSSGGSAPKGEDGSSKDGAHEGGQPSEGGDEGD